ncbi:hypothetical protein ANN_25712 [Periplaneta americana]|uniref:Uncharacterized protein n=1 Tax=Periplaneta americana TaxID=6978 RepID=A0ABQ8S4B2_PERAM|nr:hypothetical protein ANN_25712 [Periplaneta americana]
MVNQALAMGSTSQALYLESIELQRIRNVVDNAVMGSVGSALQSCDPTASESDEGDNAGEMSPGSSTESYPAFARIGLRENPGKNLNQVTCPDRDSNPDHLVSRPDALTVTPQHILYIIS